MCLGMKIWLPSYVTIISPPELPQHRHTHVKLLTQSTGIATQIKLKGFFGQEIAWPPGLLKRKNNNKVESFLSLFFMSTLTWITKKELEQVIENKGENFCW